MPAYAGRSVGAVADKETAKRQAASKLAIYQIHKSLVGKCEYVGLQVKITSCLPSDALRRTWNEPAYGRSRPAHRVYRG